MNRNVIASRITNRVDGHIEQDVGFNTSTTYLHKNKKKRYNRDWNLRVDLTSMRKELSVVWAKNN